jgi:hypothetical protein
MFSIGLAVIAAAALTLRPVQAGAQPHGHGGYHGGTHVSVGIGFGYGHPFYGAPYFYNPYWWGFYGGFYGGFWGYPSFGYGPYPYYGYPGYAYYDPSADLRLQVTPRTAEVYVDGYLVGTVDDFDGVFQRVHMPLGEHEITIYSPGYRSIAQRMLLRPFQSYKMKDTMQPLPTGAADEPRPTPAPRPARQEGAPPGAPPMEGPPPGYGNRVQVEPGNRVQVEPRDGFGTVAVRVQPADAEVLIDGERWEATAGERVLVQLSAGQHRVEVRKAGYKPYSTTVNIRSGQTFTVNVSLSSQ